MNKKKNNKEKEIRKTRYFEKQKSKITNTLINKTIIIVFV